MVSKEIEKLLHSCTPWVLGFGGSSDKFIATASVDHKIL
jgi:hypothetical protein